MQAMPRRRHPVIPYRPQRNSPPIPYNPSVRGPIAPTILTTTIVPVPRPQKLPPRPLSGHPAGTILTIPTYGPLPPVPGPIPNALVTPAFIRYPTVAPRGPAVFAPPMPHRRHIRAPYRR
jgi:hypothetical protein